LNSDLPRAHLQLAQNYTELGRVEDAVGQLRRLLAINPNSPEVHLGMAYALRYAGMLEESVKEAEKIEHIDPKYWRNQPRAVVNTYLYLGRYERFLESIPPVETAYTLFYRGFGYYHLGDLTRARENFRRAAQIDPEDVFSQLSQAMSFALDRDRIRGVQLLRTIEAKRTTEDVPDGEVTYKLAQVYALLGDQAAALKNLELAIRQGFFAFPYMERDPLVQTLRSHPDYFRILDIARKRHDEFKRRFFP
jgi:tetratricopeptide (TPR) repeat protein